MRYRCLIHDEENTLDANLRRLFADPIGDIAPLAPCQDEARDCEPIHATPSHPSAT